MTAIMSNIYKVELGEKIGHERKEREKKEKNRN